MQPVYPSLSGDGFWRTFSSMLQSTHSQWGRLFPTLHSASSVGMLVTSNPPWWEYLHHRKWPKLQTWSFFFPIFKDSWLLNIYYQHSTGFKKGVWEQSWGYQVLKQKELIVLEMGNVRGKGFRKWGSRANTTTYFTISLEFGNAPPQTIGHPHPTLTWHIPSCILTFNLKFLINHHQRCS